LQLLHIFIFEIPAAGTDLKNTGLMPTTAKFAVKYRPGRWNTGHLATLLWGRRITTVALKIPQNVTNTFFNTVHLLPKDLFRKDLSLFYSTVSMRSLTFLQS